MYYRLFLPIYQSTEKFDLSFMTHCTCLRVLFSKPTQKNKKGRPTLILQPGHVKMRNSHKSDMDMGGSGGGPLPPSPTPPPPQISTWCSPIVNMQNFA